MSRLGAFMLYLSSASARMAASGVLVLCAMISTAASAQSYQDGYKRYTMGDFAGAERVLAPVAKSSRSVAEKAKAYKFLGISQFMQGKKAPAAASFEQALAADPKTSIRSDEVLDESVVKQFNQQKAQMASGRRAANGNPYAKNTNSTQLRVSSNVTGTIMLDGILAGQTNTVLEVDSGTVRVEVSAPGYIRKVVPVRIGKNQLNQVHIALEKVQPPKPKAAPRLAPAAAAGRMALAARNAPQSQGSRLIPQDKALPAGRNPASVPSTARSQRLFLPDAQAEKLRPAPEAPKRDLVSEFEMDRSAPAQQPQQQIPMQPTYQQQPAYQQPLPSPVMQQPMYTPTPQPMYYQPQPVPQPYYAQPMYQQQAPYYAPPYQQQPYFQQQVYQPLPPPVVQAPAPPMQAYQPAPAAPVANQSLPPPPPLPSSGSGKAFADAPSRSTGSTSLSGNRLRTSKAGTNKNKFIAVLPFGAGQFQNKNNLLGAFFAAAEVASLGYGIYSLSNASATVTDTNTKLQQMVDEEDAATSQADKDTIASDRETFAASRKTYVEKVQTQGYIGIGLFFGLWTTGAVEALMHNPPAAKSSRRMAGQDEGGIFDSEDLLAAADDAGANADGQSADGKLINDEFDLGGRLPDSVPAIDFGVAFDPRHTERPSPALMAKFSLDF